MTTTGTAPTGRCRPTRRARLASRPSGCARSRRVAHRRDRRRHRRRRRARAQRARRGRRVRGRARERGPREAARARDRGGRRRVRRAVGARRAVPRPGLDALGDRRARVRRRRRRRCSRHGSSTRVRDEFNGRLGGGVARPTVLARPATSAPDPSVLDALAAGTGASPAVAAGDSGPDDLAVAPLPAHGACLLVGPRRSSVPPPRAPPAARARARSPTALRAMLS